jgi:Raf kinase inhibitor-like YbhB/YbcL family protein
MSGFVSLLASVAVMAAAHAAAQPASAKLTVTSPAFKDGATMPADLTADGKNVSPAINWSGAPANTRQFAVILHDPDAPMAGGFTHWVIYKIPSTAKGLPEAVPAGASVAGSGIAGAIQGATGFTAFARRGGPSPEPGYRGPAPPPGAPHHYHFAVYALDDVDLQPGLDRNGLLKAIEGHILAQGEIVGLYQRMPKQ